MVQTIGSLYQGYYGSNYCISMLRILWFKLLDIYVKDTIVQTFKLLDLYVKDTMVQTIVSLC